MSAGDFQRHASLIRQLQGALGGMTIRGGTSTVAFTASTDSANQTVAHGLGRPPLAVVACAATAPAFGDIPAFNAYGFTDTTFGINARKPTASTINVGFYWLAVG